LLRVLRAETMPDQDIVALLQTARAVEYHAVLEECREILRHLDRYQTHHRRGIPKLRTKLDAMKRELDRVQGIDYLKAPAGERARSVWETTAKRLRAVETRPHAPRGQRRGALPPRGSTWVTRPRPHIDRIASAWLIK